MESIGEEENDDWMKPRGEEKERVIDERKAGGWKDGTITRAFQGVLKQSGCRKNQVKRITRKRCDTIT